MHECSQVELFHPLVSVLFCLPNSAAYNAIFKNRIKSGISDCKKNDKKRLLKLILLVFMNQEDSRSFLTEHGPLSLTVPIHLTSVHIQPVRGDAADSVKLGPDCRTRGLKLFGCEEDLEREDQGCLV